MSVPKLRFPEFQEAALRSVQLGDVTEEGRSRNGNKHSVASVMGVSKTDGITPMEARLIAADINRYKIVKHDWFAYNPMRLNIGSIARWKGGREILVSPDYVVFKCVTEDESGIDSGYFDHFRQTNTWVDFVTEGGDGGVRIRIYYKDIARLELALPSLSEQQKIAACLTSIDELIAAQAQKVAALKTHKKGLMQQLFPCEGESVPRVRFPEFRGEGEWKQETMGSLATFASGGTPSKDNPDYWNGSIPWVSASSMHDLMIEKAEHYVTPLAIGNGTRIAKKGSILILVRGSMLFKRVPICIARLDVAFNQDVKALDVVDSIDKSFLLYQLVAYQSRFPINETGIGAGKIELDHLKKFELFIPLPAEQQRIAACLSSLDDLITAETQKFESLKTHKKGLMQQLFPAAEQIEA